MHQPTTKLHYKPLCITITTIIMNTTYHLIAIRRVAAKKYIQKFWKQTITRDASLCYVIITLFYITLISQNHYDYFIDNWHNHARNNTDTELQLTFYMKGATVKSLFIWKCIDRVVFRRLCEVSLWLLLLIFVLWVNKRFFNWIELTWRL